MDGLLRLLLFVGIFVVSGCATTDTEKPHVLSGEAPVEDVIAKGDQTFNAGDFEAAVILYQIAIQQEPAADYWFKLGVANTYLENRDRAIHSYLQALELNPEHTGALEKMGLYYTSKGDSRRARPYLEQLVELDGDNWKALNALGVLADLEQDFDKASDYYRAAIELRPELALLWNNLGYSTYLLGDYSLATTYISRALEFDPDHQAARINLALVYVRENKYEQALETFFQTEDNATAYTNIGYLAYKIGDYEKAEGLLEEAIRQSPTYNKPAHTLLAATRQAIEPG
jgi:Flp pilus assembly protein TadD